jgi:hypothetical protein
MSGLVPRVCCISPERLTVPRVGLPTDAQDGWCGPRDHGHSFSFVQLNVPATGHLVLGDAMSRKWIWTELGVARHDASLSRDARLAPGRWGRFCSENW